VHSALGVFRDVLYRVSSLAFLAQGGETNRQPGISICSGGRDASEGEQDPSHEV